MDAPLHAAGTPVANDGLRKGRGHPVPASLGPDNAFAPRHASRASGLSDVARQLDFSTTTQDTQRTGSDAPLVAMLLDVDEESAGVLHLWGRCVSPVQGAVLLRVTDFQPNYFIPSPVRAAGVAHEQQRDHNSSVSPWTEEELQRLQSLLNARLQPQHRIARITEVHNMHPIMFARPSHPHGSSFLRIWLSPGAPVKSAAERIHNLCKEGMFEAQGFNFATRLDYEADVRLLTRFLCDTSLSGGSWLLVPPAQPTGAPGFIVMPPRERVSACALEVAVPWQAIQALTPDATQLADPGWLPQVLRRAPQPGQTAAQAADEALRALPHDAQAGVRTALAGGIVPLSVLTLDVLTAPCDGAARVALADRDPVIAIGCELHVARFDTSSPTPDLPSAAPAAAGGPSAVGPQVTAHGSRAAGNRGSQEERAGRDVEVIELPDEDDDEDTGVDGDGDEEGGGGPTLLVSNPVGGTGGAAAPRRAVTVQDAGADERVLFVLTGPAGAGAGPPPPPPEEWHAPGGVRVVPCATEAQLLLTWHAWLVSRDPDAIATFQLRDTLGALAARATALKLDPQAQFRAVNARVAAQGLTGASPHGRAQAPGGLYLSRLLPHCASVLGAKSVVQYSPAWVKSQNRMSSTSNQETFKATGLGGRLVFDVLRQVLTHKSLATFSLVDCTHSILQQTMEVLSPQHLAQLWQQSSAGRAHFTPPAPAVAPTPAAGRKVPAGGGSGRGATSVKGRGGGAISAPAPNRGLKRTRGEELEADGGAGGRQAHVLARSARAAAARLAAYSFRRADAVRQLMRVLATVPETFEMARVTGLGLSEVQYKAQMVRTWSLLLRNARRHGFLVGGRQEAEQLIESPFLMHPIEHNTAGLYTTPVACLDFASLYPSLYRVYNLCYTTLVVTEDVERVGREHLTITPSGYAFLKPSVRQGILPSILAALMTARTRTREALKSCPPGSAARAVLDSRQKALKITANALYGFTGAQASMLQCVPLADSCLAMGAQACRTAIEAVNKLHAEGAFGEAGRGARVIYGQTDSLFIHFPHATPAEAVRLGKQASKLISERWFVSPMQLQYERVCCPFLLLHVNRYAGKSFETEDQALTGQAAGLLVKGVRSMWRQSAPFLQRVLHASLDAIIMRGDTPAAVKHAEEEIRRLLSGRVEMWELIMTGGLWRITGQQVAQAAGGGGAGASSSGAGSGGTAGGGGAPDEAVRGPHASLAVKLAQRDPGRTFLLGERIQYVLLAGARLQDEAAEEPVLSAELGLPPNLELYWKNKVQAPLTEIMEKVLTPAQLQALMSGPHTLVRVDAGSGLQPGNPETDAGAVAAAGVGAAAGNVDAARVAAKGKAAKGGMQAGLASFFKATARCLSCKQAIPAVPGAAAGALAPGLCAACSADGDARPQTLCALMQAAGSEQQLLTAATAQCMRCHSGGFTGEIACGNGECNVLYERMGAARRLGALEVRLRRLNIGPDGHTLDDAW